MNEKPFTKIDIERINGIRGITIFYQGGSIAVARGTFNVADETTQEAIERIVQREEVEGDCIAVVSKGLFQSPQEARPFTAARTAPIKVTF